METELIAALKNIKGLWGAGLVAVVWLGKELISRWLNDVAENKTGLIELRKEIHELTLAVTKLTLQIEYMQKGLEAIPEIKKDLDGVGEKVRRLDQLRVKDSET